MSSSYSAWDFLVLVPSITSWETLNSKETGAVSHAPWKLQDCGNRPCERKLRTSAREEGMALRAAIHRTEWSIELGCSKEK